MIFSRYKTNDLTFKGEAKWHNESVAKLRYEIIVWLLKLIKLKLISNLLARPKIILIN